MSTSSTQSKLSLPRTPRQLSNARAIDNSLVLAKSLSRGAHLNPSWEIRRLTIDDRTGAFLDVHAKRDKPSFIDDCLRKDRDRAARIITTANILCFYLTSIRMQAAETNCQSMTGTEHSNLLPSPNNVLKTFIKTKDDASWPQSPTSIAFSTRFPIQRIWHGIMPWTFRVRYIPGSKSLA